jgi:hypothetical protein
MRLAGNVPMKNGREIDRSAIAKMYGWETSEIYQAAQAFKAMHRRQPESTITFREYLDAIAGAGIRPAMVGKRSDQYHFARVNDEGGYAPTSARFVNQIVNQRERKEGYQRRPEFRALMSVMAKRRTRRECPHCKRLFTPGMFAAWHGDRCKALAAA